MKNCNEHKTLCGDNKINSKCVSYTGNVPEWSELHEEDCVNLEETTQNLYEHIEQVKEKIDFSDLESECLDIEDEGEITPKSVAGALIEKIEEVKEAQKAPLRRGDLDITCMDLDFKCIADNCDNPPTKMSQLLQLILDKLPCSE